MKTRKILLMTLLILSAMSSNAQDPYSIRVKIANLDASKSKIAFLEQFRDNIYVKMDSAKIENNEFTFRGVCENVVNSAFIRIYGVTGGIPVFIEKGDMSIRGDASVLYLSKIEGGKYGAANSHYLETDLKLYDRSMWLLDQYHRVQRLKLKDSVDYYLKQYEVANQELKDYLKSFVEANAGNPLGLFNLRAKRMSRMSYDDLMKECERYDKKIFKENYDYKMLLSHIELTKNSQPGSTLDDILLPDKDGNIVKLSSLRGKYVLIDFWASWCGPCRKEAKHLVDVYANYDKSKFEIFGVSLDTNRSAWLRAMEEDNTPWMHVVDTENVYKRKFAIYSIPRLMLIDPDGKIISSDIRGELLTNKLKEIFGTISAQAK